MFIMVVVDVHAVSTSWSFDQTEAGSLLYLFRLKEMVAQFETEKRSACVLMFLPYLWFDLNDCEA